MVVIIDELADFLFELSRENKGSVTNNKAIDSQLSPTPFFLLMIHVFAITNVTRVSITYFVSTNPLDYS